jgi:predicted RNA-binding protein with PIN domain
VKHYIFDGNNLIGKIKSLNQIQKKNKQQSREKLAFLLGRYFSERKTSVNLHFDGFESVAINVSGIKITYSGSISADERIKREIERSKNPKIITLVTSDSNLAEFGRVCSCQVIKSEEFAKQINSENSVDEEQSKIDSINSTEEFKKLFGIKFTVKTESK